MANIDYEEQITQVENEKQQALTDAEQTYGGMISEAQKYYQDQIDASKEWASTQQNLQQAQTDFTIEQINQQKEQTKKDYTKEQSGAYADWQKESNRYGAGAEEMAATGLSGSGYSESSQVGMYNTYQNRVAVARESYNQAVMNYNNAIKEAQLQNSSALAEIAYNAFQQELQLSLQGFQYENQLIFALEDRKAQIEDSYHNRYLDVLDQMNADRAFEESVRQYNEEMARLKAKDEEEKRQFDLEMERLKELDEEERRQFDLMYAQSSAGITKGDETTNPVIEAGANAARSTVAGQVVSGYYPGKTITNKEITDFIEKNMPKTATGSYSATGYQQKLTNDEKKLHGETKTSVGASPVPIANAGVKAGQNLVLSSFENALVKNTYAVATDYYRGELNSDAKTFGTFANGYQPKGISGHGKLTKTGDEYEFDTTKQYGTKRGKTVTVRQNIWKAEDGTLWYWDGAGNEYKPMPEE